MAIRLAFRMMINLLHAVDSQLDQIDNGLREWPEQRKKFQAGKRQLRLAVRAFSELNDELADWGVE